MAFDILVAILERGDAQDDEQRQDYEAGRYRGEDREELEDSDCRKEAMGCLMSATPASQAQGPKRWFAHMLAIRLNCSSRFLGRKVMTVYFEVMTWFVG